MKAGVYKYRERPELHYLFIGIAQDHDTHKEVVVYAPLFRREGWDGTPIMTYRAREEFEEKFEWVGDGQAELAG